jgi:hypothetical protein
MMTRVLRRSLQRQEGQALVLACLLMLVLSIALLTTVNIGHNVHERIRLQNTADAAAYSTAAMEARAFNFYAFTNRTQVSHYVSAMLWQSLNSFIFFVQSFLTDLYGFMRTIGPCFPKDSRKSYWIAICLVLDVIPVIGQIMKALDAIFTIIQKLLLLMKQVMEPIDRAIGKIIVPGHRMLNSVMAGASAAVMMSTSTYVMGTSNTIIAQNDPNVNALIPQTLAGLINQCLFNRTHYSGTNHTPGDLISGKFNPFGALDPTKKAEDDKVARAKRSMGNVTNATRFPCNASSGICPETFVTSRRLGDLMPIPSWLSPLETLINTLIPKWGQTRMLTYKLGYGDRKTGTGGNKIREYRNLAGSPMGSIAQGDVIGADDPYYIKFGPAKLGPLTNPFSCKKSDNPNNCWGDPREDKNDTLENSIWAMSDKDLRRNGIHWRVVFRGNAGGADGNVGLNKNEVCVIKFFVCLLKVSVYSANNTIDTRDNNHPWQGLAPFPHFEPGDYAADCTGMGKNANASLSNFAERKDDFNQPSTWVLLNKSADELRNKKADDTGATHNDPALLNPTGKLSFNTGQKTATLEMDNNRMKLGIGGLTISDGMTVISRGQTYYHRPGNWAEQPNFFNPYWRPRLGAVWQGKDSLPLINTLSNQLPAAVKDFPAKIITH